MKFLVPLALVATCLQGPARAAGDVAAGKTKAQACAACHGASGLSAMPDAPSLAGQPAMYLTSQLVAFKSGERRHEVMSLMAKTLSDDDIANVAAWYASLKIELKPAD